MIKPHRYGYRKNQLDELVTIVLKFQKPIVRKQHLKNFQNGNCKYDYFHNYGYQQDHLIDLITSYLRFTTFESGQIDVKRFKNKMWKGPCRNHIMSFSYIYYYIFIYYYIYYIYLFFLFIYFFLYSLMGASHLVCSWHLEFSLFGFSPTERNDRKGKREKER